MRDRGRRSRTATHVQMRSVSAIQHAVVESARMMSHASSKLRLAMRLSTHCASAKTSQPAEIAAIRPP